MKKKYKLLKATLILLSLPLMFIACKFIYYLIQPAVPVYMYHSILENPYNKNESLFVRPENFESQLEYLYKNNYTTIFASDLPNADKYKKPVVITFD